MTELTGLLERAREASWRAKGRRITFFLPGMFVQDGVKGKYPALSLTGDGCQLMCEHCRGSLLAPMIDASDPEALVRTCQELQHRGHPGVLISGGCDANGALPWEPFLPAIRRVKETTDLFVSVHAGFLGAREAERLKQAGVDQALVDLIGDDGTIDRIYHLAVGVEGITTTLEALSSAGIPIVPHVVCGLDHGRMIGEERTLDLVERFHLDQLTVLSFMGLAGTPMHDTPPPAPADVASFIARARIRMPELLISLGCARPRGVSILEVLAIDAGVNRMAIPSDEAVERARLYGLEITYQRSCCSIPELWAKSSWLAADEPSRSASSQGER